MILKLLSWKSYLRLHSNKTFWNVYEEPRFSNDFPPLIKKGKNAITRGI